MTEPTNSAPERRPFQTVYPDHVIREIRFNYPTLSNRQVSVITGVNYWTVREVRKGRRRGDIVARGKKGRVDAYKHKRGEELRLFFIAKVVALLELWERMNAQFSETGDYTDPERSELNVESGRRRPKPLAEPAAGGAAVAGDGSGLDRGRSIQPSDQRAGAGRAQVAGLLYD